MSIHIDPKNKGLLHKKMGIKQGSPISTKKLDSAEKGAGKKEKEEIVFAKNARKWNK